MNNKAKKNNRQSTTVNASVSIISLIKRLWGHLSRKRKFQCIFLAALMQFAAFAEMMSLGAVIPFIGVLTAPERVFTQPLIARFALKFGFENGQELLLPVTLFFIAAAVLSGAVRLLQMWVNTRFVYAVGHDLSAEIYRRTLHQPYPVHLSQNSSEVISGVYKADSAIEVLLQLLMIVSGGVLAISISLTLLAINPLVAGIAFSGFGIIYGIVTWITRHRLLNNSQIIALESNRRLKALQEGLGGIRDVLLGGKQAAYCDLYKKADWPMRKAQGNNRIIGTMPRFVVESLGITLLAFLAYGLVRQSGEMISVLPILGALAMGAQRLLPTLQVIYAGWATIAGGRSSLEDALLMLDQPLPSSASLSPPSHLILRHEFRFDKVSFQYTPNGPLVLENLDLVIPFGTRIGFVGSTGSGKSTALDLFMGLLTPTTGQVIVDGCPLLGEKVRAWQRSIAHVPQAIFLADATIAENIAFGENLDSIDMARIKRAAEQACLADFIESNPEGYYAFVGERGIRLSGGQRQRLGIARALYEQSQILVFDEATSALDNTTEQLVMEAIRALGPDITILIIAHRLSTVRNCDLIVELDHGRFVAQGNYEDLFKESESFRKMALVN